VATAPEEEPAGEPMLTLEATSEEPAAAAAEGEPAAVPEEPEPAAPPVEVSAAVETEPAAAAAEEEPAAPPVEEEKEGEPVGERAGDEQPESAPQEEEEKRVEPIREAPRPGPPPPKRPMWRSQVKRPQRKAASPAMKGGSLEEPSENGWLGLRVSVLILTLFGCVCTVSAGVALRNLALHPKTQLMREQLAQMDQNRALPLPESMQAQAAFFRKLDQGNRVPYVLMALAPIALIGAILSLFGMGKTGGVILLATVPVPLLVRPDFLALSTGFLAAAAVSFLIRPSREWEVPRRFAVVYYVLGWGGFLIVCRVIFEVVVTEWIAMAQL
jgi:hypothetical protein